MKYFALILNIIIALALINSNGQGQCHLLGKRTHHKKALKQEPQKLSESSSEQQSSTDEKEIGKELDENEKSEFHVYKSTYDMPTDQPEQLQRDIASVHMTEIEGSFVKDPDTKKCAPEEYVLAHWKAFLTETGQKVQDTRVKLGDENPPEVEIGHFQVVKCLDIALPQMKPGQKFKIECPEHLAYGSQSPFGMGSEHIPEHSDLTYEVELIDCTKIDHQTLAKRAAKKAKKREKKEKQKAGIPDVLEKKSLADEKKELESDKQLIQAEKQKVKKEMEKVAIIQKEINKEKKVIQSEKSTAEQTSDNQAKETVDKQMEEVSVKQSELENKKEKLKEAKQKIKETEKVVKVVEKTIKQEEIVISKAKQEEPEIKTSEEKGQTVKVEESQELDKEEQEKKAVVAQIQETNEDKEDAESEESKQLAQEPPAIPEDKEERKAIEQTPTTVEPEPDPVVQKPVVEPDKEKIETKKLDTEPATEPEKPAEQSKVEPEKPAQQPKEEAKPDPGPKRESKQTPIEEPKKEEEKAAEPSSKEEPAPEPEKKLEKIKKIVKEKKSTEDTKKGVTKKSVEKVEKKIVAKVQKVVEKVEKESVEKVKKLEEAVKEMKEVVKQAEPLKENKPFFLCAADKDGKATNLVLEVATEDKYAPKKTGVYNVALKAKNPDPDYKQQQWFYNAATNGLHSAMFPSKTLFEGMNKNLIVYRQLQLKNQKFIYDEINKSWKNKISKNALETSAEPKDGGNVVTGLFESKPGQLWTYAYAE